MTTVMLKLGDFKFSIRTAAFNEISRAFNFAWTSQSRLNNHPARHYTGEDEQTISLNCTAYPGQLGGRDVGLKLSEIAREGNPLQLVSGTGVVLGYWCIESVSLKDSYFRGVLPQKQEFSLKLSYYGDQP